MPHGLDINEVNSMKMDHLHSLYRWLSIDYGDSHCDGARKLLATSARLNQTLLSQKFVLYSEFVL